MFLEIILLILPILVMAESDDDIEFYETVPGGLAIASSCVSLLIVIYVSVKN